MRTVSQSEAVATLSTFLEEVEREPIVIEKDGREVAIISSPDEYSEARQARVKKFLTSFDKLSSTIQKKAAADHVDLNEVMRSLDRKAE